MSYAEVVSNTRSSIVHACRKESCRACVVFDKEMCDRKSPDVQTCQKAGFSAEQTSSVSPIKKGQQRKCVRACKHVHTCSRDL